MRVENKHDGPMSSVYPRRLAERPPVNMVEAAWRRVWRCHQGDTRDAGPADAAKDGHVTLQTVTTSAMDRDPAGIGCPKFED